MMSHQKIGPALLTAKLLLFTMSQTWVAAALHRLAVAEESVIVY